MMLNLRNKKAAVIGGGNVGLRKVQALLGYGADIQVISPFFIEGFGQIANEIQMIRKEYEDHLIVDCDLVIAASSSRETNEKVGAFCRANRILCNIADDPKSSDFMVPSSFRRGSLVLSVSTEGKSPGLAAKIRKDLAERYPPEYEEYVDILGEIREELLIKIKDEAEKKNILRKIIEMDIEELKRWRMENEDYRRI